MEFDKSGLLNGLLAFNTSATLAIFLTLFHSENRRIVFFRDHKTAAATMYTSVILNTVIVSGLPLFMNLQNKILNVGIDNLVTTLSLILTLQVTLYLLMLVNLYTKN